MHRNCTDDCPNDLIPTRASLLDRLENWGDDQSWRTFFETYWRLIYNFALKQQLTHEEAQEVVQETILAVAKNIGEFRYQPGVCRFKSWLLTVTRSKIADQLRKRPRHCSVPVQVSNDDSNGAAALERFSKAAEVSSFEAAWDQDWHRALLETALRRVKNRIPIEHFQMFDLFVVKGWPARDVAKTLGVSVAHVYVAKHRISKLVQKEIRKLEGADPAPA